MAFKLAEAFVEFTARTQQATAGMEQIEQQAQQTATQIDTQMATASASVSSFGAAMIGVGTFAAVRFASGVGEGIKAGGSFADVLDSGIAGLVGMESHLQRVAEIAKTTAAVLKTLHDAEEKADETLAKLTTAPKSMFPAFGEKGSAEMEADLHALEKSRNAAFRATADKSTEISALRQSSVGREGNPIFDAQRARLKQLESESTPLAKAATEAELAVINKLNEFTQANRNAAAAQFLGRTGLGLARGARDFGLGVGQDFRDNFDAARAGLGPLGFLGQGASVLGAMFSEGARGTKQIDELQKHQQEGDARFAGVKAIEERFKKQIDDAEADIKKQREIERTSPRRAEREGAEGRIAADKDLIEKLREQEAEEKRRFVNTSEFGDKIKSISDTLIKIWQKPNGWAP